MYLVRYLNKNGENRGNHGSYQYKEDAIYNYKMLKLNHPEANIDFVEVNNGVTKRLEVEE